MGVDGGKRTAEDEEVLAEDAAVAHLVPRHGGASDGGAALPLAVAVQHPAAAAARRVVDATAEPNHGLAPRQLHDHRPCGPIEGQPAEPGVGGVLEGAAGLAQLVRRAARLLELRAADGTRQQEPALRRGEGRERGSGAARAGGLTCRSSQYLCSSVISGIPAIFAGWNTQITPAGGPRPGPGRPVVRDAACATRTVRVRVVRRLASHQLFPLPAPVRVAGR